MASQEQKNKRIDNDARVSQYKATKLRLNKKFSDSGITINKLKDELNKLTNFEINYETLRKTLDITTNTLDIYCVIALCKYFNMDIAYVLSDAKNPANEIFNGGGDYVSERYARLADKMYKGRYYGYLYSPKKNNEFVDSFILDLQPTSPNHDELSAKLEITYNSIDMTGTMSTGKKTLTGIPVLVRPNNVYIVFHENAGAYYIFSFNYVKYNIRNMYFRRGAIITQGRDASRQAMMQSFVLFEKPIDIEKAENVDIIKGFLLLSDDVFHIPVSKVKALIESDKDVANLYDNLKYIFEANREEYYLVDETQLLHSLKSFMSKVDAVRVLQLMKAHATDAKRIYFPERDEYSEFSKLVAKHTPTP